MCAKYIITVGPESSGKTTILEQLSKEYGYPFRSEAARDYLATLGRSYNHQDLRSIAELQESTTRDIIADYVLCDTDLVTLLVWQAFSFPLESDILSNLMSSYDFDQRHYLLMYPDLTWVYDPLREHRDLSDRLNIFDTTKELLDLYGARYSVIKGVGKARFDQVVRSLQLLTQA